eukprot:Skav202174  [mRNA]  locus=scaffold482:112520:118162:+ [translate_table: standard]
MVAAGPSTCNNQSQAPAQHGGNHPTGRGSEILAQIKKHLDGSVNCSSMLCKIARPLIDREVLPDPPDRSAKGKGKDGKGDGKGEEKGDRGGKGHGHGDRDRDRDRSRDRDRGDRDRRRDRGRRRWEAQWRGCWLRAGCKAALDELCPAETHGGRDRSRSRSHRRRDD